MASSAGSASWIGVAVVGVLSVRTARSLSKPCANPGANVTDEPTPRPRPRRSAEVDSSGPSSSGIPTQWPAVRTLVGEITVPVQSVVRRQHGRRERPLIEIGRRCRRSRSCRRAALAAATRRQARSNQRPGEPAERSRRLPPIRAHRMGATVAEAYLFNLNECEICLGRAGRWHPTPIRWLISLYLPGLAFMAFSSAPLGLMK